MTDYPQIEDVKEFDRNEKPTEDDALYASARAAAIDTLCDEVQRELRLASATPSTRTFVPDEHQQLLYIGDCAEVVSVVENGRTLAAGVDYQAEPVRRTNWTGQSVPFNSLRRFRVYWWTDERKGTVVVNGRWGVDILPPRAIEAVRIITSDIVANRDVQLGIIGVQDGAIVSARNNPAVMRAIEKLRSEKAWGMA